MTMVINMATAMITWSHGDVTWPNDDMVVDVMLPIGRPLHLSVSQKQAVLEPRGKQPRFPGSLSLLVHPRSVCSVSTQQQHYYAQ